MASVSYITEDGLRKLREELDYLIRVERPAISRQIAEARDKGDLSENAEYAAAKEAQGMMEMKIAKLEKIILSARVIDESKIDTSSVQMMNKVKIRNTGNGQIMEYTLVSEAEADVRNGKLSVKTPIGKALIGKKVGDKASAQVPSGVVTFEILEISK